MNRIENTLTSLEVSEMVGKNHADVMRDIRRIIEHLGQSKIAESSKLFESKSSLGEYFAEDVYINAQNKELPCYRLTKKGCELFSTRMTGAKGTQFAVAYIERFNQMEENIKQVYIPKTQRELAQLALAANEETAQRLDGIETKVEDLTERFGLPATNAAILAKTRNTHIVRFLGGKDSKAYPKLAKKVFAEFGRDFKESFGVPRYDAIPLSRFEEALAYTRSWQPSYNTMSAIRITNLEFEIN